MAALSATELQDAIIFVEGKKFNQFEGRLSRYGALKAFMDGANEILPESTVTTMKKSEKQPEKVPVLNKFNSTVLTNRTCTITGPTRVSAFKALSYVTKGFEIVVSDAINAGNYISRAEDFGWQMIQGLKAVYNALDLAGVNALETNRNTTLKTSTIATITNAAGDYEENLLSDIYYDMPALMALNDLSDGRIQNVTNTEAMKNMLKYESQGQNNAIDLAGVLSGKFADASDYQHYLTNNINLGTTLREAHYLFPQGAVGLFVWNAFEFQKRSTNGISRFYTQADPILGITWNVYETTDCVDLSTLAAGMTGTGYVTKYQFSADFSFLTAYASDADTPIVKVINKKTAISS